MRPVETSAIGCGSDSARAPKAVSAQDFRGVPTGPTRPRLGDHEVAIRATWLGLASAEDGVGDDIEPAREPACRGEAVGLVVETGARVVWRPGARVIARRHRVAGDVWIACESDVAPVPDLLEPSLATLGPALAKATRAVEQLPHGAGRVLIDGYGEWGALVHAELARRSPRVEITVAGCRGRAAELARAFGARVVDAAQGVFDARFVSARGHDGAARGVVDLQALAEPTTAEVVESLEILLAQQWRFLPLITDGLTASELRSAGHRVGESVKAVVWL